MLKSYKALLLSLILLWTIGNTKAQFKVIGYFPNWASSNYNYAGIQYDKLTHINYAFAIPTTSGTFTGINSRLDSIVKYAHLHNVKVLVSVGGINGSANFATVGASATLRTTFTQNLLNIVTNYNLDGADIDWEFPINSTEATNCSLLMKELSDSLHNRGKLSSMAVNPFGSHADNILSDIFPYVDFLNLMAYDNGTPHSSMGTAASAITYWLDRGLPPSKTNLGVPFYGRNVNGIAYYKNIVAVDPTAPYLDETYYGGKMTNYNGIPTIKAKTKLAWDQAGGIMIWELTNDTNDHTSLLKAINDQIRVSTGTEEQINDSDITLFPNPANSQIQILLGNEFSNSKNHITISDLAGKKLMNIENSNGSIDVNSLDEGLYIITIVSGGKTGQKKLVISRK